MANLKSILLVGNHLSGVGMSRAVGEDLAEQLVGADWDVFKTSTKPGRIVRLVDMVLTTWRYRQQYAVAQVDVFSGSAFIWAEVVTQLLHWLGKPYLLTLHGGNLPFFAQKWPGRVTRLLHRAKRVTVPSPFLLEQMRPYGQDLFLLPNPIDLASYEFCLRPRPRPHLIWLRAFHTIYNPPLAVQVLADLLPDFPSAQLTMIGPDKQDGSLQQTQKLSRQLGVSNHLQIVGHVPKADVPLWLNKGDIFLNTTHIDNTPISVMEAMACGLCVVSTNVGGIPYLLTHEQDALLIEPDRAEQGAAAVRRLLTDPTLAMNLSQNAHNKVQQFDWPIVLKQWQELLLTISR